MDFGKYDVIDDGENIYYKNSGEETPVIESGGIFGAKGTLNLISGYSGYISGEVKELI